MNYIKNIILFFGSILLSFFLVYLIVLLWVSISEKYISDNNFINKEELNFHRNYSNKVHHLRGKHFIKENIKKEEYFFTEVSKYSKNKINFLIQGDSWAEYLSTKNLSKKTLNEIAKINKIGLINAGIASFSPSPMTVQFQILKEDFNISPSVVIAIIDQTDLGDELCRGTESVSGKAIVAAGICKLRESGSQFIFATHLHGLDSINEVKELKNVKAYHLSVEYSRATERLIYDRQMKEGSGSSLYGLEVCKAMDMDNDFLELANRIRKREAGEIN